MFLGDERSETESRFSGVPRPRLLYVKCERKKNLTAYSVFLGEVSPDRTSDESCRSESNNLAAACQSPWPAAARDAYGSRYEPASATFTRGRQVASGVLVIVPLPLLPVARRTNSLRANDATLMIAHKFGAARFAADLAPTAC